MVKQRRFTATSVASLILAVAAFAAVSVAAIGPRCMIALPLSWILASVAVVAALLAVFSRRGRILAVCAALIAAATIAFPYLIPQPYLSNGVDIMAQAARWMSATP